jgi:VWFA-related protein
MSRLLPLPGFRGITLAVVGSFLSLSLFAQTPPPPPQDAPTKTDSTAKPEAAPAAAQEEEVSTHDSPTTFKVRVNLVLVRVVVRDKSGKPISNLKKEDFQLFDNKKLQTISSFSVETPDIRTASAVAAGKEGSSSSADVVGGKAVVLPQRFVSMVFDDVHLSMEDAVFVRDSATRFFEGLAPSDRVSLNTTSGQITQEFTDDHGKLMRALNGILPRSTAHHDSSDCPDVSYYQADLMENKRDSQAIAVAIEEAVQCMNTPSPNISVAQAMAESAALRALSEGDAETNYAYRHLDEVVRRLGSMPGQRVLVLVSPGFLSTTLQTEAYDLIDRSTRGNIVINTIDARGLYVPDVSGDITQPQRVNFPGVGLKVRYRVEAQSAQEEVLRQLADGTGGKFYHNRNDVDEAMREAGAAPAYSYLLGFSPQNLKIDGAFHNLKVSMTSKEKFDIQARHGYFAPRTLKDPAETSKQEIQEALFSQEEIHDLPVELQTQFFKKEDTQARLAVLTHFDVKGIHFRKGAGRNNDQLTIVTGIFDENGNIVTGGEKIIEMKLLDTTYNKLSRSGFTVKSSFDVKPGTYLVRLVVRDAEGAQMAARNGAVVIPY